MIIIASQKIVKKSIFSQKNLRTFFHFSHKNSQNLKTKKTFLFKKIVRIGPSFKYNSFQYYLKKGTFYFQILTNYSMVPSSK